MSKILFPTGMLLFAQCFAGFNLSILRCVNPKWPPILGFSSRFGQIFQHTITYTYLCTILTFHYTCYTYSYIPFIIILKTFIIWSSCRHWMGIPGNLFLYLLYAGWCNTTDTCRPQNLTIPDTTYDRKFTYFRLILLYMIWNIHYTYLYHKVYISTNRTHSVLIELQFLASKKLNFL